MLTNRLINNQPITMSSGIQLFDVIDVIDCANTYLAVMEGGKRLSSYMAGSGKPQMLKNYILEMQTLFPDYQDLSIDTKKYADVVLSEQLFDTSNVIKDTNFTPKIDFKESLISLKEYIQKNSFFNINSQIPSKTHFCCKINSQLSRNMFFC